MSIFSVTAADVLKALSLRIDISTLSPEEIELACQDVKPLLEAELDIRHGYKKLNVTAVFDPQAFRCV